MSRYSISQKDFRVKPKTTRADRRKKLIGWAGIENAKLVGRGYKHNFTTAQLALRYYRASKIPITQITHNRMNPKGKAIQEAISQ